MHSFPNYFYCLFTGVDDYDVKRVKLSQLVENSRKILEDVDEKLLELNGDFANLDKDQKESDEFVKLDKKKRAITHVLLNRERARLEEKLSTNRYSDVLTSRKTCGVVDLRSSDALRRQTEYVNAQQ